MREFIRQKKILWIEKIVDERVKAINPGRTVKPEVVCLKSLPQF